MKSSDARRGKGRVSRAGRVGCAALGALLLASATRAEIVDVYVFDFAVSVNLPDLPVVDPVIYAGDTIRWVWLDDFHNVVSCAGQAEEWESDVFQAGDTFVYTFTVPGVYQYYCAPHGHDNFDGTYTGMGGQVTVLSVPGPGAWVVVGLCAVATIARRRRNAQAGYGG